MSSLLKSVYFLFFLQWLCVCISIKTVLFTQCTAAHNFVSIDGIEARPFLSRKINVIHDAESNLIVIDMVIGVIKIVT